MLLPYRGILVCVAFALVGASALGMALSGRLGEPRRETADHLRLVAAILAVFATIVLGLSLTSAKGSHDAFDTRLRGLAGSIVELDRRLRQYGGETAAIRTNLRAYLAGAVADIWRDEPRPSGVYPTFDDAPGAVERMELGDLLIEVDNAVRKLEPSDPFHAGLANLLEAQVTRLLEQRRLTIEAADQTISLPLLAVITVWLAIVLGAFGLTAPRNAAVCATILLCALSFVSAIALILDFDRPLTGFLRVSSAPALEALHRLDAP